MSHQPDSLSEPALDALIARERTRIVAPLTEWRTLSVQLREEGLLRGPGLPGQPSALADALADAPRQRTSPIRVGMRVLAGTLLLGTGVVVGRVWSIGDQLVPLIASSVTEKVQADSTHMAVPARPDTFASTAQAWQVLAQSQGEYQRAAAYLTAKGDTTIAPSAAPRLQNRLAALDEMANVTRKALGDAPQDPLLNQYYLMTIGAREATREQFHQALPPGARLATF